MANIVKSKHNNQIIYIPAEHLIQDQIFIFAAFYRYPGISLIRI